MILHSLFARYNQDERMDQSLESHIVVKLFIGFPLRGELRSELKASKQWKESSLQTSGDRCPLEQTHLDGCDYIGCFSTISFLSIHDIKVIESEIRQHLLTLCPKLNIDKLKMIIFPQIFIF